MGDAVQVVVAFEYDSVHGTGHLQGGVGKRFSTVCHQALLKVSDHMIAGGQKTQQRQRNDHDDQELSMTTEQILHGPRRNG